jgi:deoxyribodipyrimidine photolyase-related protein
MVPNVYDMGQFASGGIFATKPYISSSNYIRKMSNYSRGEWADIWDGLYWRFLDTYQDKLSQNHRMGLVMHQLETMNKEKLDAHKQRANSFLSTLF